MSECPVSTCRLNPPFRPLETNACAQTAVTVPSTSAPICGTELEKNCLSKSLLLRRTQKVHPKFLASTLFLRFPSRIVVVFRNRVLGISLDRHFHLRPFLQFRF